MAAHRPSGRGARRRGPGSHRARLPRRPRRVRPRPGRHRRGRAGARPARRGRPPGRAERGHRAHLGQRRRDLARRRRGPGRGRGTAPARAGDLRDEPAGRDPRGRQGTDRRARATATPRCATSRRPAGLLAGSLYSHFRSKAEIVRDIVIRFYDELLPAQQAVLDGRRHRAPTVPRDGRRGPRGVQPAPRGADDPALRLAHALRARRRCPTVHAQSLRDARPLEGGDRAGARPTARSARPSTPRRWSASPPARSTR